MILGPGWAFLGLLAGGIAAFLLIGGSGLVVVDRAPGSDVRLAAPALVEVDQAVEARRATIAAVAPARAKRELRGGLLRIRNAACDGVRSGAGLALDPTILVAHRDVLPGGARVNVAARHAHAKALDAVQVYRLGEFGIARVDGRLPRLLPLAPKTASGASVAVIRYPLTPKPRLLPGVVVDTVSGTPFGVRGPVLRLTSELGHDEAGGPVVDAKGRVVALAFTSDPRTGLAVAVPVATLRALVAKRSLEPLPRCDGS